MATLRRAGFGSVFEVENETVGIGTTGTATNTLQVLGDIKSSDATVIGLSTLTTYQGFVDKEARFGKAVIDVESQAGTLGEIVIEGDVTVSSASTLTSSVNQLTLTDSFSVPTGNTDSRIHCHTAGSMRFNEDLGTLEFYTGDMWKTVNSFKDIGNRGRAVVAAGIDPGTPRMEYLNMSSQGNSIEFGELSVSRYYVGRASSSIRGLFGGGEGPSPNTYDTIDYITIASTGNAIDFGNLTAGGRTGSGASSSTRGLFTGVNKTDVINYVQIMTLGNALDFGDILGSGHKSTATSSPTRFFYQSGSTSAPNQGRIEVGTIASTGDTIRFGDITDGKRQVKTASNQTRALFAGGYENNSPYPAISLIDKITMASEGNATNFGNLTSVKAMGATTGSQTRFIYAAGSSDGNSTRITAIDSVDYASDGNAISFGEMGLARDNGNAVSDSHGGLGGF